jgi:hypothetical protein
MKHSSHIAAQRTMGIIPPNPPLPPFGKEGHTPYSPFRKGGYRGIFRWKKAYEVK